MIAIAILNELSFHTNSRASLFELLLHQQKNTKPPQQTIPKRRPFLKPKDSPSTFPRSQVRSRSLASIDWRITRSCRISFSTTLKSSSYLAWSKSFLPDWKLEVGTLLFWEVEIWTGSSWFFKMPPQNAYDVKLSANINKYPSSHNHGSEKWVPPILVAFHFG